MFEALILWWLFGRCGSGAPALPSGMPGGEPGWPGSPISFTPPWPQQRPSGLPPFPGSSWEFDEPPPPAVQQRARQLVDVLWKQGNGASRVEQTAGRWIAYQAQVVSSGKRGVVAYRQKRAQLPAGNAATASRAAPVLPAGRSRNPVAPASSSRAPAAAPAAPRVTPAVVSPVEMPVLMRGAGIKPKTPAPSPNVRILQQRLGIAADGEFGKLTDEAVRRFQSRQGLKPDGIVGPKTWTALFATVRA